MYDQSVQKTEPRPTQEALLQDFGNRFSNVNDTQASILNSIEDKLHQILNKRTPQNDDKQETPTIGDFMTMADVQLKRLVNQNNRLECILSHLNQII